MFDIATKGINVPAIQAIHSFDAPDSTKVLNDSQKDILTKGIYMGGRLVSGGELAVEIEPFAAKTCEGMTLRNDLVNTKVEIEETGKYYMICLFSKYLPSRSSYVKAVAIPLEDYEHHPERKYLICFGSCDLTAGNTIVLPGNLSELGKDNGPFQDLQSQALYSQEVSSLLDTFSSSIYSDMAFDGFNTDAHIDVANTSMMFNRTLHCLQSKIRGDKYTSVNLLPEDYTGKLIDICVFCSHTDDAPIIKVKAKDSGEFEPIKVGVPITLKLGGSQLFFQFIASKANVTLNNFSILFNKRADLEKIDEDSE